MRGIFTERLAGEAILVTELELELLQTQMAQKHTNLYITHFIKFVESKSAISIERRKQPLKHMHAFTNRARFSVR
jgi:hypothetical protein